VDTSIFLSKKDKWLIGLIGSSPYVKGRTRLQKYGILAYEEILKNEDFFNDWRADNFGGFSPQLAQCVRKLERRGYVSVSEMFSEYGEPVERYELTGKGVSIKNELETKQTTIFEKMKTITGYYFQKPLKELLDDVYSKYPKYTPKSKIRAEVNRTHTNNHTFLSTEYEITDSIQSEVIPVSTVAAQQHVFGDDDFRNKIARSIGLDQTPDLDVRSFDRIKGILSDKINTEDFDSEELVKDVRGC
jgi:hypothetical protein